MPEQRKFAVAAAYLTLCVIWSSTWLAIKIGLRDLPPISFVALRFAIAVAVLLAISVGRVRLLPLRRGDLKLLAYTGVLMFAVNYALLFWAELYVSSGLSAVLQATIPIFGMVFAHYLLPGEPLRWQRVAGALLAIGGVALICSRLLDFDGLLAFWGGVAVVFGAATAAFSNVMLKSASAPACARHDRRLANDLRHGAAACARIHRRWKSDPLSLDENRGVLPSLSRGAGVRAHLSAALLAAAANVGHESANDLAHHAAGRGGVRVAARGRDLFALVARRRRARPRRRVDDFPRRFNRPRSAANAKPRCRRVEIHSLHPNLDPAH